MRAEAPGDPRLRRDFLAALGLVFLVLLVYGRVLGFDFVNMDDPLYVSGNRHVLGGFTREGVRWAFTSLCASNWHPLTMLSHMGDVALFGVDPGLHHLVNVAFHAANAVLVFLLLKDLRDGFLPALLTAALFAIHPLHVESVAWVAERKDVLSTCFLLLALGAYGRHVRTGGWGAYLGTLGLFALGLLAKPMLVTLPLLLVILDHWPFRRGLRLREKLPFALLSALSCGITFLAQRAGGSVMSMKGFPLTLRLLNALASCGRYLAKAVVPVDLVAFYPMETYAHLVVPAVLSAVGLVFLAWGAWRMRERRPYLLAGLLWYLVTLIPVIGLVQVGQQGLADRYTYVSLLGPMAALAWLVCDLARERRGSPRASALAGACATALLAMACWRQVGVWRDSETLFRHAVQVNPDNFVARTNLGFELYGLGRPAEALPHLEAAVRLAPGAVKPHYFLGRDLAALGRGPEALLAFKATLDLAPRHYDAMFEASRVLVGLGRAPEAEGLLRAFLAGTPARMQGLTDPAREEARSLQALAWLNLIHQRNPAPLSRTSR